MTFYLTDLLLFPAITQGIIISIFLWKKSENRSINRILAMLLCCSAFMLAGRMVYDRFPPNWPVQIAFIPDVVIFIFGPVTYLFFHKLLVKKQIRFILLHFLPSIIYSLMVIYFFTLGASVFNGLIENRAIWKVIFFIETSGILSNIIYTALSINLLARSISQIRNKLSYKEPIIQFLKIYLFMIVCCLVLWLLGYISSYILQQTLPFVNYNTVWYSMPFISYLVGYYMMVSPPIFSWNILSSKEYEANRLHPSVASQLRLKLNACLEKEKVYLHDTVTLKDVADLIDISPHNLSSLLNDYYHQCFYDFINDLRIKEFVAKVYREEYSKKTILGLAMEVGFRSKSTFNKSFKAIHKKTPSEFISEIRTNQLKSA